MNATMSTWVANPYTAITIVNAPNPARLKMIVLQLVWSVRSTLHQLNAATHKIVATLADVVLHLITMLSPSFIVPSAIMVFV